MTLSSSSNVRPSRGFTLVELLVVIAIIAVLASVLLVAGTGIINQAKRTKASSAIQQIQTACLGYYTEYSVYPVPASLGTVTGDVFISDSDSGDWAPLIEGLCGNVSPANPSSTSITSTTTGLNTRGVAFMTLKSSDVGDNTTGVLDCPLNPITPGTAGTGKYFNLALDTDYDGLLGTTGNTSGKLVNIAKSTSTSIDMSGTSTAGVALWANCNAPGYTSPKSYIATY